MESKIDFFGKIEKICKNSVFKKDFDDVFLKTKNVKLESKDDFIKFIVDFGVNAESLDIIEKIAKILGLIPEEHILREEKLNAISEIMKKTSVNPTPIKGDIAEFTDKINKRFALDLKDLQLDNPGKKLKVAIFGIFEGCMAYYGLLYADALGVNAKYVGVDKNDELMVGSKLIFKNRNDIDFLSQDLFELNSHDSKWGGVGSYDCIDMGAVMHEIYSYGGLIDNRIDVCCFDEDRGSNKVNVLLSSIRKMLCDGGRLILADGQVPEDSLCRIEVILSKKGSYAFEYLVENYTFPFSLGRDIGAYKIDENIYNISRGDLMSVMNKMGYVIKSKFKENIFVKSDLDLADELKQKLDYDSKEGIISRLNSEGFSQLRFDTYTSYVFNESLFKKHITLPAGQDFPRQWLRILSVKGKADSIIQEDHPPIKLKS